MKLPQYAVRYFLWMVTCGLSLATQAEMLFEDSFSTGKIDQSQWILDKKKQCDIEVDEQTGRNEGYSVRFEAGLDARCEILPWFYSNLVTQQLREPYDEDRWYSFSVFLVDDGSYTPCHQYNECNEVIAQWHSSKDVFINEPSGRGPPLALRILGNVWRITHGWDDDFLSKKGGKAIYPLWVGAVDPGVWTDWVFRVRWTRGDEDGLIQVWKNGVQVIDHSGPIGYNDIRGNYLKLGSYHPPTNRVIYIDEVRVGDEEETYETMKPRDHHAP